ADDVLDLLRIDEVVGQVVVDFGVGQVALLEPLGNQELDVGLFGWTFVRHVARTGEKSEPVIIPFRRTGFLRGREAAGAWICPAGDDMGPESPVSSHPARS